jgi:hypothetical protein
LKTSLSVGNVAPSDYPEQQPRFSLIDFASPLF